MTIEIHQPALEALIRERMAGGGFESVEDLLMQTLEAVPAKPDKPARPQSLEEMFAKVRGLADDLDLGRDPAPSRPVDLS